MHKARRPYSTSIFMETSLTSPLTIRSSPGVAVGPPHTIVHTMTAVHKTRTGFQSRAAPRLRPPETFKLNIALPSFPARAGASSLLTSATWGRASGRQGAGHALKCI
ncbi:unnamed protein product [Arctogadus glacialis]